MSDTGNTALSTVPAPAPEPESGRHPVNVGHLVMGIAFVGLAFVWALVQYDVVEGRDIRWLLPVPWVLAGAAGLAASAVTGTRRHQKHHAGWVGQPATPTAARPPVPSDSQEEQS
ncbi:hypothetical protein NPS01_03260 [Nocardioides psychrotolerans]|uniref:Uncharacterized protein n=1 Tax=Nocardioides psychrotolerans TaxID=1005945 RepID=A0A1I3BFN5_9ACTN|nr:hypothetical protein [Nocardioides psychrotolerans]GEP36663.1 hypothetical protein NPS01_03260 [Nocardioides psychrotolerans]SFH61115.1 hypothetical protein SAMN05216561_101114 [Nocardioides psychrotolerans]